MGREGPCCHCGFKRTPHWRAGPPEKPVLCNACGSRWRTKGTLHNYIPRHANRETRRYRLPSEMNPRLLARDDQEQEVGVQVSGQEGSSACPEEEMNNIPSLGSAGSSSGNCMQMKETNEADKDPFWNPDNVPKRKRSELTQLILSPVERLQRQLQNNLQKPEFENIPDGDEDVTLIYARNKYIPPNEIGLGVMLLVSPTTTTERLTSLSPMAEDDASCSMNVPDSNLINNNVLDHVAMQNETTGNGGRKAIARENELAPHYMDTTSMVSGQKVYPQRDGEELGNPVKRQRGRPRLSTTQGKPRQG